MTQLTMYVDGSFTNPFDATCFVALTEKRVPFTMARAMLRERQPVPPALAKQVSIARIPALQHGDFLITESLAIAEYLEEAFPPPAHPALLPADLRSRARARQVMSWVRTALGALREERSWWMLFYPAPSPPPPLSTAAQRDANEMIELVGQLAQLGELAAWNLSHAELAFNLLRLSRTGHALPEQVQRFLDEATARPSVRAYLEHPRPPHRPAAVRPAA